MLKVVDTAQTCNQAASCQKLSRATEYKVRQKALSPHLERVVANLENVECDFATGVPGVSEKISSGFARGHAMNLIHFPKPKGKTQYTDPALFFLQMGCDRPPHSCTVEHLEGFYSLTDSCLLSNWMTMRDFLDFDVFSNLKKIHKSSSPDLKQKIQAMMTEWCLIRANATYNAGSGFLLYFKEVSLFHHKLKSILANADHCFPKIIAKLEKNYHFLLQFIGKEHQISLINICLSQLSGTHNMIPTKPRQAAEVLGNLQTYAECMVQSAIIGHNNKLTPTNPLILQNILSQIQTLINIKSPDMLTNACKNFRRECEETGLRIAEQFFPFLGGHGSSYQQGMGNVSMDNFMTQIKSLPNRTATMQVLGLFQMIEFIADLSSFVEGSILSVADSEYIEDKCYISRIDSVLISLCNELADFTIENDGLGEVSSEDQSFSDVSELGQFLENFRIQFYQKLLLPHFFQRASDYVGSTKLDSVRFLVHFCVKNLYEVLRPLSEEAVQLLKKECSKYSPTDFASTSLFAQTQWLAKALLLVHDMGCLLKDPTTIQDIEFHPDYLEIIVRYDPSVRLQMGIKTPEEADLSAGPQMRMDRLHEGEDIPEAKRELLVNPLPSLPAVSVSSSSSSGAIGSQIKKTAVAAPPTPLQYPRSALKDAIRGTHGDLRQLSRIMRSMLGWTVRYGQRHPTIIDGRGQPVAPVPNTGHAGLGTLLNVANSVCDAAAAQGLV